MGVINDILPYVISIKELVCLFFIFSRRQQLSRKYMQTLYDPLKTNIAPETVGVEHDYPFRKASWQVIVFGRVNLGI